MSIVIFGDLFTFPDGNAATNRVYTYAKGLTENGIKVHVICSFNQYNSVGEGEINEIHFYNPFGQSNRSNYFILRRWKKLKKYYNTIKITKRINKNDKLTAIIVYSQDLFPHLFAWYLTKVIKTKLIQECNEHPLKPYQKNAFSKLYGFIGFKIESYICDGVICISQVLMDYYKDQGFPQSKLFHIPSTVDPERFSIKTERPFPNPYIGYFGGLTIKRDNIDLLIKSFSQISNKYPDLQLVLGGFCLEKEKEQIMNLIQNLQIPGRVILLEYLSRNEITRYITNAKILVMVRSNDLKSQASFPSKLTEYLSTSIPVISVNVGEISNYLIDSVNSFLIEPNNQVELEAKIEYILNNYDIALNIAKKGNDLTSTIFNYNYQAKRMIKFIQSLK